MRNSKPSNDTTILEIERSYNLFCDRVIKDKKKVQANDLVKKSFKYREMFNESHPEYQINNWDCGWYQIKALLKEFIPDDLKEFRVLYKQLADKMRPMVYELGFLKK